MAISSLKNKEFHDELNLYYTEYKILHDFSEVDDEIIKISALSDVSPIAIL